MKNAVAFANNDVVTIAWSFGQRPEGCMGFAVYRIDDRQKETPLPSHAVFKGRKIRSGQTTAEFPVQKFYWKDVYARLVAEKTGNRKFRYKIVPLEGKPGALQPMKSVPFLVSNEVEISARVAKGMWAYFNRGLISTQRIARAFKKAPQKKKLLDLIAVSTNALRASLSGDMVEALTEFVARAGKSGTLYAALYELGDAELVQSLTGIGKRLKIVLSNSAVKEATDEINPKTGKPKQRTIDGNAKSRKLLAKSASLVANRMMPSGHIGHNKFLVYADRSGPKAVLLGSTNWTATGLCTQTNNTLVIEDAKVAKRYLEYWKQLAADTKSAGKVAKLLQALKLRTWASKGKTFELKTGEEVRSWFSPNTPKARSKPQNEKRPPDMSEVRDLILGAKHAILFLAFYPGTPSLANWAAEAQAKNEDLFVRGCVTNPSASEGFYYELRGQTPPKRTKDGPKIPIREDRRVVAAQAFDKGVIPEQWRREILSAGFAIIHDKVLVIDPFSDHCAVITGSHNLGHKASFDNDENLVIVKGNKKLAVAYATHVLDVYDHFSWRVRVKKEGPKAADQSLKSTPRWLDQYFDENGDIRTAQLKFWMQATA